MYRFILSCVAVVCSLLPFMSEVPFLDSCLGPDLTTLNEDDLLRYFLNDESPFDSKVPSPLLDPPSVSLVYPLPKQYVYM